MSELKIGYARVSTEAQDLTAQHDALLAMGVELERIYVDHGLTGANRRLRKRARGGPRAAPPTRKREWAGLVQAARHARVHREAEVGVAAAGREGIGGAGRGRVGRRRGGTA